MVVAGMVINVTGSALSALAAVATFAACYLAFLRVRRNRAARRPITSVPGLVRYERGTAPVATDFRVWPDVECVNPLCPQHFPCMTTRRPMCFHPECPLDGHPMMDGALL